MIQTLNSLNYKHFIIWTNKGYSIKFHHSVPDRLKVLGCQSFPSSWISNRIPSFSLTKGLCHQLESQRGTEQFRIFSEHFCCHLVTLPGIADQKNLKVMFLSKNWWERRLTSLIYMLGNSLDIENAGGMNLNVCSFMQWWNWNHNREGFFYQMERWIKNSKITICKLVKEYYRHFSKL